jgi:hypothetical protein
MTDTPWSGEAKCKALQAMERYREEAGDGQKRSVVATTPPASGGAVSEESDVRLTDRIRQRARAIYEQRKALGLPGDAEGDWLQAEAELGGKTQTKPDQSDAVPERQPSVSDSRGSLACLCSRGKA